MTSVVRARARQKRERKKEAPCPGNAWRSLTGRPHAPGKTTVTGAGNGDVSGADGCLFVDIMPAAAGKGLALTYVRQTLFGMLADECLVAGDSGNDVAMFQGDVERGIMVRIATPSACCWGARARTHTHTHTHTHTLSLSRAHTPTKSLTSIRTRVGGQRKAGAAGATPVVGLRGNAEICRGDSAGIASPPCGRRVNGRYRVNGRRVERNGAQTLRLFSQTSP